MVGNDYTHPPRFFTIPEPTVPTGSVFEAILESDWTKAVRDTSYETVLTLEIQTAGLYWVTHRMVGTFPNSNFEFAYSGTAETQGGLLNYGGLFADDTSFLSTQHMPWGPLPFGVQATDSVIMGRFRVEALTAGTISWEAAQQGNGGSQDIIFKAGSLLRYGPVTS